MSKICACFCYPFVKPKEPCNLVMFCETKPAIPEDEFLDYLKRCMEYAKAYHVYLLPGRFILKKRLCLCLITPQGKPALLQKATQLNLLHHSTLKPAGSIQVAETEFGKIALMVDVDIFHPEAARAAAMQGAEILLASQFYDLYDWNPARSISGCWDMAQQNQIAVLGVSNMNCCVCAPCSITQDGSGFILSTCSEFPALATVYPHKITKLREQDDLLQSINPEFCARYFSQLDR